MKPLVRARHLAFILATALLCAASVHAAVTLLSAAELSEALKNQPPCCVIDARSAAKQRLHPLVDAVRYRPGLRIIPTASVIVVADDDQAAAKVGASLAKQHPGKTILAVEGGVLAWQTVLKSLASVSMSTASGAPPSGVSFVIPHNTCETGTPLQILQSKPKP